jgi:hypothetical protein
MTTKQTTVQGTNPDQLVDDLIDVLLGFVSDLDRYLTPRGEDDTAGARS